LPAWDLFGLVTFTAEQRVKEIGVRKVLGADVFQIVSILSKDLILLLVAISFIIAFPSWILFNGQVASGLCV
jgi:putative ABC transport system permease protein